jgi:hypothetical protein
MAWHGPCSCFHKAPCSLCTLLPPFFCHKAAARSPNCSYGWHKACNTNLQSVYPYNSFVHFWHTAVPRGGHQRPHPASHRPASVARARYPAPWCEGRSLAPNIYPDTRPAFASAQRRRRLPHPVHAAEAVPRGTAVCQNDARANCTGKRFASFYCTLRASRTNNSATAQPLCGRRMAARKCTVNTELYENKNTGHARPPPPPPDWTAACDFSSSATC